MKKILELLSSSLQENESDDALNLIHLRNNKSEAHAIIENSLTHDELILCKKTFYLQTTLL